MNKIFRKVSVVVGLLILVGGIYFSRVVGTQAARDKAANPTELKAEVKKNYVYVLTAQNQTVGSEVVISGKVIARQKLDLVSEVTGRIVKASKEFREGVSFSANALMLTLEDTDAQYSLQAAKSQLYSTIVKMLPDLQNDYADNFQAWKAYVDNFDNNQPIRKLPTTKSSREKLYVAVRNLDNQYINIKKQEFRLTKYKIYAPFTGILSHATVYEGALVRAGQKLGTLTHPSRYEVEATISLYDMAFFKIGNTVNLYSNATSKEWKGRVARFGKTIDEKTQTQKVFITVNSAALNEGMFLNGKIKTKSMDNVVQLARTLLVNNRAVYTVIDNKLHLEDIEVVKVDNNEMYVRGLEDNVTILAQPILGAYEGMLVDVIED